MDESQIFVKKIHLHQCTSELLHGISNQMKWFVIAQLAVNFAISFFQIEDVFHRIFQFIIDINTGRCSQTKR